jgi:hypothetical protein
VGVLVTFESHRMLLQREDFSPALARLKKIAKDVPGFFRDRDAVAKAKDLATALAAAELPATLDEHGDLVGVRFDGDKLPPGAPDGWPEQLLVAWKKLLKDTRLDLWMEGMAMKRRFTVDRGALRSSEQYLEGRRFEQLGTPPRCRPGESCVLSFRYVSDVGGDDVAVQVRASDSAQPFTVDFAPRAMRPGDEATMTVRLKDDASWYPDGEIGPWLFGDGARDGSSVRARTVLGLVVDIPEDLDGAHEVVATDVASSPGAYLRAKALAGALEDMRRYAARHAAAPGGAFLARVAAAGDTVAALREAGFEPTLEGGGVRSLAFARERLPGSERHVIGLLRSFAGLTTATSAQLRLAYASAPDWWTTFVFDPGSVRRVHERRARR